MKSDNSIEVKSVRKKFKVFYDKGSSLKEKILFRNRNRYDVRWVLNGISFEVKKGEAIGLIGHNGCGKSTTLKLLTRIIYPDEGTIEMRGRVSSLIELGAGFHPDMSGRENIYTNASIFGLTKKEIDRRIDDIIEFSEMEEFLDNPVRTYSSGMYMRLAFSVAINVDAEILLIDEILTVGDANFQAKCFNKLREIKAKGTTIVIVSHSLPQIEQICDRCIWIQDGTIHMEGSPVEVDYQYLDYMGQQNKEFHKTVNSEEEDTELLLEAMEIEKDEPEEKPEAELELKKMQIVRIKEAELMHLDGSCSNRFKTGEPVTLRIAYTAKPEHINNPVIGLKIYRNDNVNSYGTNTQNERLQIKLDSKGYIYCHIEKLNLIAGEYNIDIAIRSQEMFAYDYKSCAVQFGVYYGIYEEGIAHLDHTWEIGTGPDIKKG